MKTIFLMSDCFFSRIKRLAALFVFLFCASIGYAQTTGDYRSAASGNWTPTATSIWETWDGTSWVATSNPPPTNNGAIKISIVSPHVVSVASSTVIGKTVIEHGGQLVIGTNALITFSTFAPRNYKMTVSGLLVNNGTIVFSDSASVSVGTGGVLDNRSAITFTAGTLLTINGTFRNSASVSASTADRVQFNNGAFYEHNFTTTPGTIPNATWNTGSTCRIIGYTSNTGLPTNFWQTFYNFEWNTPALVSTATAPTYLSLNTINGNLSINNTGSGVVNVQSLAAIGQNFTTASSSKVQLGSLDFQLSGNLNFASGSITRSESLNLMLVGSKDLQVDVKGLSINNLTIINPSHSVTLNSQISIKEVLSIASSNTTLVSNGYLKLLSTSDEGYMGDASISAIPAGSSITGNVAVERYMGNEGNIYRYISAPVSNFKVSSFQNDIPVTGSFSGASACSNCASQAASLYYYVASAISYQAFPRSPQTNAVVFEKGRGYAAFINQNVLPGPATIHWLGPVNQGTIDLPVSYSSSSPTSSWNLVGNPYPSTIDWNEGQQSGAGWSFSNIAQPIAVKDNSSGAFQYYPDGGGNETLGVGKIAKGQAFWVRATGPNPTLQINESAKTSSIGTFYRTDGLSQTADRIVLSLSNGTASDRAYFKVSQGASAKIDFYDAPKMTNDGAEVLNLATLLPGGTMPMAINAVDKISCSDTIKLRMTGPSAQPLKLGSYTFSLASSGVADNFTWMLQDAYLKVNTDLTQTSSYSFTVTTTAASKDGNRFQLIAVEKAADLRTPINGTAALCGNSPATLKINNSQSGISYTAMVNGQAASDAILGNNGEIVFNLSNSIFSDGKNSVRVLINSGCNQRYLVDTLFISKSTNYIPQIKSAPHCQQGTVTLQATNLTEGNSVHWYSSPASVDVLGTGAEFLTPVLSKSKTYYASGVNALGCEGDRTAVTATIINFDAAQITPLDGNILQSSYTDNNQWYFNDQLMQGENGQTVNAKDDGTYTVQVNVQGCSTSGRYAFTNLTTAVEKTLEKNVLVYPNPVSNAPLHIEVPNDVQSIKLLSSVGSVLIETIPFTDASDGTRKADVELSQYPAGIYFVQVNGNTQRATIKVAKK